MTQKQQRQIKILFVVNTWANRGAEQQLIELVKSLPDYIFPDIFIFTNEDDKSAGIMRFGDLKRFPKNGLKRIKIIKALLLYNECLKWDYDVLVTEGLGSALFFGRICAILTNIPACYSTLHTMQNLHKGNRLRYFEGPNRFLNFLGPLFPGKRILRYLCVTKKLEANIKSLVNRYPVETVWNAIFAKDVDKLKDKQPGDKAHFIKNKIEGHATIIQVGNLDQNKNQLFTLKCITELKYEFPDIRYIVVGDGDKKSELYSYTDLNDLHVNVLFAGQLSHEDCLFLINQADVLVLTSLTEAFPLVVVEAMACSVPVVSFDVGGVCDAIEHGINGYLIRDGRRDLFLKYVKKLIRCRKQRARMGSNGRRILEEKFLMRNKVNTLVSMIASDLDIELRIT